MFYDKARIYVKAGSGGNGVVAFRKEKYVPRGGPNGGNGGRGGNVILYVDLGLNTLYHLQHGVHHRAERGEHGGGADRTGANAADLRIPVPPGTIARIMAPMALPALATVTIFTFQATWNDFLAPLIYLQKPELYTVTLGLQFFRSTYTTNWAYLMAASLVTTLPVIVVFFAAQRYFIEGITLTGVKG